MKAATLFFSGIFVVSAFAEDCGATSRRLASDDVPSLLLDDSEAQGVGWHSGTYTPCLQDAYRGMFHHDWARDKGRVSAEYKFDPPKDGCYVIEEYHPGKSQQCSQYLPNNVRIVVDFCKGRSTYTYMDQSQGGGMWNILGALPFYVGWQGVIKVANNGTANTCMLGRNCFWVADAFRVTWVSDLSNGCRVPHSNVDDVTRASVPTTSSTSTTTVQSDTMAEKRNYQLANSEANSSVGATENFEVSLAQALAPLQTLVDNIGLSFSQKWQTYDARSSEAFQCGIQGWKQSFLYLDPSQGHDAETAIEFPFEPPEDGCYLLEEFHPENRCNIPFSPETAVVVHYCKGMKAVTEIDQTKNGNQWTTVGLYPFFKGFPGKVLISHPQVGSSIAIADALRFTRVSESCSDAHTKTYQYMRLAQNAPAELIDNKVPSRTYSTVNHMCGHKAIGEGFHAATQGEAEVMFEFEPASTGCYRIDAYHPENDQEKHCALMDNANVEVNWCLGKRTRFQTPLKGNGNQWNTLGHFKYYAGAKGSVISRRSRESTDGKYWVADAIRFTKVAPSCDMIPDVGLISLHITGSTIEDFKPSTGLTSYADIRIALQEALVQATQLPHDAIRLLSMRKGSVIADFEVRGTVALVEKSLSQIRSQIMENIDSELKKHLCQAISATAECKVTVMQVIKLPAPNGTPDEALPFTPKKGFSWSNALVGILIVVSSTFVIILSLLVYTRTRIQAKTMWQDKVTPIDIIDSDSDVVEAQGGAIVAMGQKKEEPNNDESSMAGSTITPSSTKDFDLISVSSEAKAIDNI